MTLAVALGLVIVACLLADMVWYEAERAQEPLDLGRGLLLQVWPKCDAFLMGEHEQLVICLPR